jgi:hypothetical protein
VAKAFEFDPLDRQLAERGHAAQRLTVINPDVRVEPESWLSRERLKTATTGDLARPRVALDQARADLEPHQARILTKDAERIGVSQVDRARARRILRRFGLTRPTGTAR